MNFKFGKKEADTANSISEKFLAKYYSESDTDEQPEQSRYCLLPKEEESCNCATD